MDELAMKFPTVKFIKSIAATCIPNYPEKNLPTIFVYFEGAMIHKFIGPEEFHNISAEGKNMNFEFPCSRTQSKYIILYLIHC